MNFCNTGMRDIQDFIFDDQGASPIRTSYQKN